MRRGKTTTYGQKGGMGPNTGKTAVFFEAEAPSGKLLRKRFFRPDSEFGGVWTDGVAALLPPINGYDWSIWAVHATQEGMPGYVRESKSVVYVPCRRITAPPPADCADDATVSPREAIEAETILGLNEPMSAEGAALVEEMTAEPSPEPDYRSHPYCIEHVANGYRLKDYDHPMHRRANKPFGIERYAFVGVLRDDFTRFPSRDVAETVLADYVAANPYFANRLAVRRV